MNGVMAARHRQRDRVVSESAGPGASARDGVRSGRVGHRGPVRGALARGAWSRRHGLRTDERASREGTEARASVCRGRCGAAAVRNRTDYLTSGKSTACVPRHPKPPRPRCRCGVWGRSYERKWKRAPNCDVEADVALTAFGTTQLNARPFGRQHRCRDGALNLRWPTSGSRREFVPRLESRVPLAARPGVLPSVCVQPPSP
jgi:hypothetical protein